MLTLASCLWSLALFSFQEPAPSAVDESADAAEAQAFDPDEFDARLSWRTGEIALEKKATLRLPDGFRYLDPRETKRVLEDVWGNPPDDLTWGMIFPSDRGPFHEDCWGVVLRYVDEGHVSDDDANEIDYDELLDDMKESAQSENEERTAAGFGTIDVVGWAERPRYDAQEHELFWARELSFDGMPVHTLNYDVRILARKGVLSMNAVAGIDQLPEVREGMTALLSAVEFDQGHRYADFNSSTDKLAAYGIGGLIAGKLALKAGLFKWLIALLVAGKKAVIAVAVGIGVLAKKVLGRSKAPTT